MDVNTVMKLWGNFSEIHGIVLSSCVPKEARRHFQVSRKEALLGLKSILEEAIDRCEEAGSNDKAVYRPSSSQSIHITE